MKRLEEMDLNEFRKFIDSGKFRIKTIKELEKEGWEGESSTCLTNPRFTFSIDDEIFTPDFNLYGGDISKIDHEDESFKVPKLTYEWIPLSAIVPLSESLCDNDDDELLL